MKKYFFFIAFQLMSLITHQLFAQGVGINSTGAAPDPSAMLHVDVGTSNTKGVLATGTLDINLTGTVPSLGAGSRLMFYPGRAAFRVGYVTGPHWDNQNVGFYSIAMGQNTIANNSASTAMGYGTTASGFFSTAMGFLTTAGDYASTAMGRATTASGYASTAMGQNTIASGSSSTAMGYFATASGDYSTAMGTKVSTNDQTGSFVIGDSDPTFQGVAMPGLPDLFVARFNNGYYLLTSGYSSNMGVAINHNGNAWVSICDQKKKENFESLNGEEVLQKISKIKFTSWNYKQQDPKIYRHYGIMAQDFYNAFGKDRYGNIGNDTTVNPIDMIGIDMTAIQALEKRTSELQNQNAMLFKKVAEVDELKKENNSLKQSVVKLQMQFEQQQKLIAQGLAELKTLALKQAAKETVAVH